MAVSRVFVPVVWTLQPTANIVIINLNTSVFLVILMPNTPRRFVYVHRSPSFIQIVYTSLLILYLFSVVQLVNSIQWRQHEKQR